MKRPKKNKRKSKLPTEGILRFDQYAGERAFRETRVVLVNPGSALPPGEYAFIEHYCANPQCDCRRAILSVWSESTPGQTLATIGFGWESMEFYRDWNHGDEAMAAEMKGASLEVMQRQTPLSIHLLDMFENVVLNDKSYVERLKTHYEFAKKVQGARKTKRKPD